MSLSLIALAAFSACSDEVENGTHPGKGDQRLSFAVSMGGANAWKPTAGTRAASDLGESTYELEPVEMEGKVNGKTVYLTAEVMDGFPGDNCPITRGTQISETNKTNMEAFAISAYTDAIGTPDFMYNETVTLNKDEGRWYPTGTYYWPAKKQLSFYAWFPSAADGMTLTDNTHPGAPVMTYIVPDDVKKQQDVMSAVVIGKDNPTVDGFATTDLTFNHALSAVKFVAGDDLPNCVVKSIKLSNLQYKGYYDLGTSTWTEVKSDKKDFAVSWGYNAVEGKEDSPVTREDETFFLVPQTLEDAKVEVTFMNTDNTEFTVGAALSGTWEKGKTYIYKISHNFVYLGVSNEWFIAYVDKQDALTNQIACYINAGASTAGTTGTISEIDSNITVEPTTFTVGSNIPVRISWPAGNINWQYTSCKISMGDKEIWLKILRPNTPEEDEVIGITSDIRFEKDDPFYIYSLPETTSKPFKDKYSDSDIVELQNVSESDWLAITPLSTYNKNAKYQAFYDNSSKGDIYLQTLSVPTENRFASLLACKEDMKQNVMYCVEQKAFTADFGFKGCERNISREAEKWNIVLNGGRFKENVTNLKARVVISSDVPDTQISDLERDLTYGDPVAISVDKATSTGVSATPYVKKRWDNLQNNPANNGTRKVNVQVKNDNLDEWYDCGPDGLMSDRFTWGDNFAIGYGQYHGINSGSNYLTGISPIVLTYSEVHKEHPMFGLKRWSVLRWQEEKDPKTNAVYRIWRALWYSDPIYRNEVSTGWTFLGTNIDWDNTNFTCTYIKDPDNPGTDPCYNGGWCCPITVNANWSTPPWAKMDTKLAVWIPIVYTDTHCNMNARPTDTNPITGTSVNE